MKSLITLIGTLVSLNAFAQTGSVYTDLDKDCVVVSAATDQSPIDFYTAECKAFGGYRLTIEGGDLRYHPTLSFGDKQIDIPTPMGFHDVASKKIEWVYNRNVNKDGVGTLEWKALIYRLSQATEDGEKDTQMLYVVRLDGAQTCLVGTTQSNTKAREMAANSKPGCK